MDDRFMKERPVFPLLISMALPMVISMLVNSLYNIVDSYFVARISEDAFAALSLVFPIQNLINAVTIGFGIGVNAAVSYTHLDVYKRQVHQRADAAAELRGAGRRRHPRRIDAHRRGGGRARTAARTIEGRRSRRRRASASQRRAPRGARAGDRCV